MICVVSPELPCGSAWLANCFFELGIPVWNLWDVGDSQSWQRTGSNRYTYTDQATPWLQTLPALRYGREFEFLQDHAASFRHVWPAYCSREQKTLLFVRDPRDALYSHWRRQTFNDTSFSLTFEQFVHSQYHHYPISFREYLLLYLHLWRERAAQQDVFVVRYEDYRLAATETLTAVLHFLGLELPAENIERAIRRSDFSRVKGVEDQMQQDGELDRRFNYAGVPYEYAQHFTAAMHDSLGSEFDEYYEWLGYEPYGSPRELARGPGSGIARLDRLVEVMACQSLANQNADPSPEPQRESLRLDLQSCSHLLSSRYC